MSSLLFVEFDVVGCNEDLDLGTSLFQIAEKDLKVSKGGLVVL
jgi:hypothetical protein